jgi:hypothetical protein
VRKVVQSEYRWLCGLGSGLIRLRDVDRASGEDATVLAQRRRVLSLFIKDLSSGASGKTLENKSQRDSSLKFRVMLEGVSLKALVAGWVFVILTNGCLLLYVYLFAMNQTQSRQSEWFQSFLMWLLFEVIVSSTGLVVLTHLLIPLFVLADVAKIKEKLLGDFMAFRDDYVREPLDEEEGKGQGGKRSEEVGVQNDFNAAKYLYPSWRVASLFPELRESRLILKFKTLWPKRRFGHHAAGVAVEYEQAVILTALSRIFLYFLGSFIHFPTLVQDIFIQTVCNTGMGFLGLWMIHLYAIHPALPVAMVLVLILVLGYLLRVLSTRNNEISARLASVAPYKEQEQSPPPDDVPSIAPPTPPPALSSRFAQEQSTNAPLSLLSTASHHHTDQDRVHLGEVSLWSEEEEDPSGSEEEEESDESSDESEEPNDQSDVSLSSDESEMVCVVVIPRRDRGERV